METVKDIIAEMRGYSYGMSPSYHVTMSWADFRKMLTRLEAAHDHDIATATEACARAVVGACVKQQESERKCVALREALKQVNKLNNLWFDTFTLPDGATSIHDEIENVISAALAATEKEGGAR